MPDVEPKESAKAVQELAKTAGKGIDASRAFGAFLERIFGGPLDQISGTVEDSLRFRRTARAIRFATRYEQLRSESGIGDEHVPVEMKLGIPLIECATLEEDDMLQDMFARLLVTATDPKTKGKAKRAFVSILQDLGQLEAQLLSRIYQSPQGSDTFVRTAKLPEEYLDESDRDAADPPPEVQLALWNLVRAGCIEPAGTWGGGSTVSLVTITALGRAFIEACTTASAQTPKQSTSSTTNWDGRVAGQMLALS